MGPLPKQIQWLPGYITIYNQHNHTKISFVDIKSSKTWKYLTSIRNQ